MDGNLNLTMDQLKKEQPVMREQQQTIREHLSQLQRWDVAEGQTLEERRKMHAQDLIQQNEEMNLLLREQVEEALPPVQAQQVADGVPVQVQVPAKQTWKEKRAEKNRLKEARKIQPLTDAVSVHMMQSLKTSSNCQNNSLDMRPKGTDVDVRVLRSFVKGYRKKWTGSPATEQDAQNKEADRKFIDDYCSKDLERRRPHLERIVNELLLEPFDESLLSFEYLEHHAGEIKQKISRGIYFENVYKDPINRPYFDSLPLIKKDLIEHRIFANYANLALLFTSKCNMKAVDSDKVMYNASLTRQYQTEFANTAEQMAVIFREGQESARAAEKEAVQREFRERLEASKEVLMQTSQSMKEAVETLPGDIGGLNLTGYATGYSFDELSKYRKMIETHPVQYDANKQIVDRLYRELYQGFDALGEITLHNMAAENVIDNIKSTCKVLDKTRVAENLIVDLANEEQQTDEKKADQIIEQIEAYAGALVGLLLGKEFSESAKFVLRRFGHNV